jgi:glycosyltransferase involved in cell wall biosynthesis
MPSSPGEPPGLHGCRVGVDARYLKRRGVGISWYLHAGLGDLLAAGARLTLLTDAEAHRAALAEAYPQAEAVALPGRSGFAWEQRALRRHLDQAGYDAYLAPANYGLPGRYRGPTQLFLVVHDLIPLRLPHWYLLPRPPWAAKYLLSLGISAARADHVIAVSQATARDVARLLRRPSADVAYPPIPARDPQPPSPGRRPYFAYNGGSDVRKNVPALLRAFAQVRSQVAGVRLVMLGADCDGFRPLIHELGLDDHVDLPGYIDEAAKAAVLRDALALVYPSRLEGFGLPLVEAFAAGVPVVAGTGGALREIGGDAAIFVAPLTVPALAAAMTRAADQSLRPALIQAGDRQLDLLTQRREQNGLAATIAARLARTTAGQPAPTHH